MGGQIAAVGTQGPRKAESSSPPKLECSDVTAAQTAEDRGFEGSVALHGWPYFGLTTTLNTAAYCASLTRISAAQRMSEQVMDAPVDHYGSEGRGGAVPYSFGSRERLCGFRAQVRHP